jgi:transketolase
VQHLHDGWTTDDLRAALDAADAETAKPSLIIVRTHIAIGAPHAHDTPESHGAPLGEDEVRLTKEAYGWDPDKHFYIPDEALGVFRRAIPEGEALVEAWNAELERYTGDHPDLAAELKRRLAGQLPDGWDKSLPSYAVGEDFATRQVSQATLNALAAPLPGLFGGAADLSESNLTDLKGGGDFSTDEALGVFRRAIPEGEALVEAWQAEFERYRDEYPELAAEFERRLAGQLPDGWDAGLPSYAVGEDFATRQVSQATINVLAGTLPELFGGAADLSESNLTDIKGAGDFSTDEPGRNLRFGVREHAMGGIANGIAYHGQLHPYCATFLTFSDYMRGSVRLAALAGMPVAYVWTHDSVGLGEDGPTHQPVEQPAALRAIPNLWYIRPGDANEAVAAWALAIERRDGPVALGLTRQKLTTLPETAAAARDGVRKGGWYLWPRESVK